MAVWREQIKGKNKVNFRDKVIFSLKVNAISGILSVEDVGLIIRQPGQVRKKAAVTNQLRSAFLRFFNFLQFKLWFNGRRRK